jgi:uncharacterized membrane protein
MTDDDAGGNRAAERLILFSDAVVAIAITLLALDLHVPAGDTNADLWHDFARHADDYISFLISFAVIGGHWMVHHRRFTALRGVTAWLMRWNMLWLLTIVLTPFATRVIVGEGAFAPRFALYAAVQVLASGFLLLALAEIDRRHLAARPVDRDRYLRLALVTVLFLLSIPVAFLAGRLAYACWVAIPLGYRLIAAVRARRPSAAARDAVPDRT